MRIRQDESRVGVFFLIIIFLGTHLRTLYIAFLLRRGVLNLEH